MVYVLVLCEETQPNRSHVKISIDVHPRVVTHVHVLLGAEDTRRGVQDWRMVFGEIPHIDTYLRIQRAEPCSVVIQPVLQMTVGTGITLSLVLC